MNEQNGIASNPENYRTVYQLQFDTTPNPMIVESPLFLNVKNSLSDADVRQPIDILLVDKLTKLSMEENKG